MNPYEQMHQQPAARSIFNAIKPAQSAVGTGKGKKLWDPANPNRRRDQNDGSSIREQPGDDDPHDTGFDPLNPDAPSDAPKPAD